MLPHFFRRYESLVSRYFVFATTGILQVMRQVGLLKMLIEIATNIPGCDITFANAGEVRRLIQEASVR